MGASDEEGRGILRTQESATSVPRIPNAFLEAASNLQDLEVRGIFWEIRSSLGQVQWITPVISALWEAKVGGS